jgi:invasion protein IalB
MNFHRNMALATLMIVAIGSGAMAQEAQPSAETPSVKPEKFKDWDLFCPEPKAANAPRMCEIRTIIVSDKGQRLGALAVATITEPGGAKGQMIASALVPLGVDLTSQPTLAVGEGQPIALKFLRCLQRGCEAVTPLSESQQAALRAGTLAKVAVGIGGEKKATFEFSLAGFTAAHDALKKRTGAK